MDKKELTKELLVGAAQNLNEVLGLNPKIAVVFESTLKGAPLKAAEQKFVDQLEKDIVEAGILIAATDTLEPKTVDVLEALGVENIRERLASGGTPLPPATGEKKKSAAPKKKGADKNKKGGEEKMATKKVATKKVAGKKAADKPAAKKAVSVEKDSFGFRKGSKSSEAIGLLAAGKLTAKEARKQFDMLSFGKLLKDVESRGFKIKEDDKGKCSITGKLKD